MLPAVIAGVVAGVLTMAFAVKLLYDLVTGLRHLTANLPGSDDLNQLRQAIAAQQQATDGLPDRLASRVAGEVRQGLAPVQAAVGQLTRENQQAMGQLAETLSGSHAHLNQVLMALDHDGGLGEWVTSFRETTEPFQLATDALTQHYETGGKLLSTTGELVRQWADQREAVQVAFRSFSDMVERSQAAETTHLRDIEHRVMNRLEEVAETNTTVSHALSELQTASRRTQEAHESLSETVRSTVDKVGELIDLGRQTQAQHHELIRGQEAVQKRFTGWHADMEERIGRFQRHLEETPVRIGRAFQETTQKAVASFAAAGQKLERFHAGHAQAIEATTRRQAAVAEQQAQLLEAQGRALADAERRAGLMPTRNLQIATLALLGLQAALLGVLAFGLFQLG